MKSSKLSSVAVATLFIAVSARAAHVDMTDPRRALGREDDVRIDAQLIQETVSSGSPVGITYQIENLTRQPIAVADKLCDVSYDNDSRTITLTVGSEVPKGGEMPHLTVIGPGEKKTLTTGAVLHVAAPTIHSPFVSVPQLIEIQVNILRDLTPFHVLIEEQSKSPAAILLTDQQFDQWLQSNDTILLNAIPVRYNAAPRSNPTDAAESHHAAGTL
jgi:hypothetical protein